MDPHVLRSDIGLDIFNMILEQWLSSGMLVGGGDRRCFFAVSLSRREGENRLKKNAFGFGVRGPGHEASEPRLRGFAPSLRSSSRVIMIFNTIISLRTFPNSFAQ